MSADDDIHIIYFEARGRAELLRLILKEANASFRETRIPPEKWAAYDKGEANPTDAVQIEEGNHFRSAPLRANSRRGVQRSRPFANLQRGQVLRQKVGAMTE